MKKVIIDRELMMAKMSKLMKFVPKKVVIPAFENMMFVIYENMMNITATDGNIQCVMTFPVKSKDNFIICVPAALVFKTVSLFRENEVVIKQSKENKIELSSGKSKYNISLDCTPEGFPVMQPALSTNEINMQQFFLKLGLRSAGKFVDDENINVNMTAINIQDVRNKIVFTGLSRAIMCRVATRPISINHWDSLNIPTETASKVASMLGEKGEISITHNNKHVSFFTGKDSDESFEVMSTIADIKFPNSESLFDNMPVDTMCINTTEFMDAVKRLKLYSSTGEPPVFRINTDGPNLKLTCVDSMMNKDGEELITIMSHDGDADINYGFQNEFMVQVLSNIDQSEFVFYHRKETNRPCIIIPKVNNEEENIFSFLILPVTT